MPGLKTRLGVNGAIFVSLCRILCLDPLVGSTQTQAKSSWLALTDKKRRGFRKTYTFRLIFLTVFISALHGKIRIYDVLYVYNISFRTYVLVACSTVATFLVISQMIISAATLGSYRKIIKRIDEIYDEELYNMRTEFFNGLCFPENCIMVVMSFAVFMAELCSFDTWTEVFACGILDVYTDLTMYATCFTYFNVNYVLKKSFMVVYRRSKEIGNVNELKKLWIDYLRLHSAIEKVNKAFGLKVLFTFAFIYTWQLQNLYTLLTALMNDDVDKKLVIAMSVWLVNHALKFLILISTPPACKRIIRKFKMRMGFYVNEDSHIEQAIYIRNKLIASEINFTACNWFDVDYSLAISSLGSLILNLIILLQFANPKSPKRLAQQVGYGTYFNSS